MQKKYLDYNTNHYTKNEIHLINYYLRATLYKFILSNICLEQLWTLSSLKRNEVYIALENSLDKLDVDDQELLMISFVFENFLLQSKTFLDFLMLYLTIILKTGHNGSISRDKFFKSLRNVKDDLFKVKSLKISKYFESNVFGTSDWNILHTKDWGSLLTSLRDKISHRDIIKSVFKSNEYLFGDIFLNWPTLHNITYDRFCQYIQNGMFTLFPEVTPILFDLKWETGMYHDKMWN